MPRTPARPRSPSRITTPARPSTNTVRQSGSATSGEAIVGQRVTSTGGTTRQTTTNTGRNVTARVGTTTTRNSGAAPATRRRTGRPAGGGGGVRGGGGGGAAGGGGGGEGGGVTEPGDAVADELEIDFDTLNEELERQRQFILEDQALDDQEKALALQELETQANFARQQYELARQGLNEQIAETQRQTPLTLRDIGDQYASQGAFYSGRRAETQQEAEHQASLAISGLRRQLAGEELSQAERDALAQIGRQKIELGGKRDDLQTAIDLYGLENSRDLTPEQLFAGLEEGIITSEQLSKGLQSLGYSQNEANYLTKLAQSSVQQGNLSEAQLAAAFDAGVLDVHHFKKGLRDLGYTPEEASILAKTVIAQREAQAASGGRQVSPSQLETAFRQGLISDADYVAALQGMGYPKEQAQLLAASAAQKGPLSAGKGIGQGDLEQAYNLGLISKDNYIKGLVNLGYPKADAVALATIAEAELKSGVKGPGGQNLSKTELKSLYGKGLLSKKDFIKAMAPLGFTKDQASAIADSVTVKPVSGGAAGYGDPSKWPTKTVGTSVIGPWRGAQLGDPTEFITKNYEAYTYIKNSILKLQSLLGKPPTLSQFVDWFGKDYQLHTNIPVTKDGKQTGTRHPNSAEVTKYLSTYSLRISLAWYRLYYGGGKKYPYKAPKAAPTSVPKSQGGGATGQIEIF